MSTDPTMRIIWFEGHAYPISSHPRGLEDPGTHWHVQTLDGEWHQIMRRKPGGKEDAEAWRAVMARVEKWLADRAGTDRTEA